MSCVENVNTLDRLLQIEARAAALVSDAQEEAGRRLQDSEEKNQKTYEDRFRTEIQKLETSLQKGREKIKLQYQNALDEYRKELSGAEVNTERFSALLNEYLFAQR